jgi:hypothetical protein
MHHFLISNKLTFSNSSHNNITPPMASPQMQDYHLLHSEAIPVSPQRALAPT